MGCLGYGKLAEGIKVQDLLTQRMTTATVWYNGYAPTTTAGTAIDCLGFDNMEIKISTGTVVQGPLITISNAIYESDQDSTATAVAVTGGSFTNLAVANTKTSETGSVDLTARKRYIWLRTEVQGATAITADFNATAVLGAPRTQAVSKTLKFDL